MATVQDPTVIEFDVRTDEMLVNMGPQHPSTHGVLRLVLRTDGEVISEVTPHLGYLHRCAEKIGENVTPIQFIPYTDRMDYLAGMNMNLAYSLAVEKLCGMKLPEKANVIRVLIAELNRIASHLVGMGAYGLDLGTFSPFLYAFREREMILDLFEEVCGARLTYSYITIGGVHDDLPTGWVERCREFLTYLKPRIPEYHALLTTNHIFVKRTANIGNLSKEAALDHGCRYIHPSVMHSTTGVVRGRETVRFVHQWSQYALTIPKALFFLIDAIFAGPPVKSKTYPLRVLSRERRK